MPNLLDDVGRGVSVGRNVEDSHLVTGDRNRITEDERRSNNMSVQFAPTDATRFPGVVYTVQEIMAQVNNKLDEHGKQLQVIRTELVEIRFEQAALKREFDEMRDGDKRNQTRAERDRQQTALVWFRLLTVVALVVIIVLILRLGAL